jgi:hypothetical protein
MPSRTVRFERKTIRRACAAIRARPGATAVAGAHHTAYKVERRCSKGVKLRSSPASGAWPKPLCDLAVSGVYFWPMTTEQTDWLCSRWYRTGCQARSARRRPPSTQRLSRSGMLGITLERSAELRQRLFSAFRTEKRAAELIVGLRPLGCDPDSFAEAADGCRNISLL